MDQGSNIGRKDGLGIRQPDIQELIRQFYHRQIDALSLSPAQIGRQSREQLENSLRTVTESIENADSFGKVKLKFSSEGDVIITSDQSDFHHEVGITPALLEIKRLILERITQLDYNNKFDSLGNLIDSLRDQAVQSKLMAELEALRGEIRQRRQEVQDIQERQKEELRKQQIESAKRTNELEANLVIEQKNAEAARTALASAQKECDRKTLYLRLVFSFLFLVVGAYLVLRGPLLYSWRWLLDHPKKLGLQASAIVVLLGITWIIIDVDKSRRWFAFGSLILAAVIGVIQLL